VAAIAKAGTEANAKAEQKKEKVIEGIIDAKEKGGSVTEVVKDADLPFEVDTKEVEVAEKIIDEVREEVREEAEKQEEKEEIDHFISGVMDSFTDVSPEVWDHEDLHEGTGTFRDDQEDHFAED